MTNDKNKRDLTKLPIQTDKLLVYKIKKCITTLDNENIVCE